MRDLQTIECPSCGRALPANVLKCHFCGGDLAFVGRPDAPIEGPAPGTIDHKLERLYRGIAYFWVFDGTCTILVGLGLLPPWASGIGGMLFNYLGAELTTGFLILILGIGMLLKVHMARWLVGAFCWFRVIMGLLGIGIVMRTGDYLLDGHNIIILGLLNLMDTVFAGFQIWLLSATDYDVLN